MSGYASSGWVDPADDEAARRLPVGRRDQLLWSERQYLTNTPLRVSISRQAAYFTTQLSIDDVNADDRDRWERLLTRVVRLRQTALMMAVDQGVYGDGFCTVYRPFVRFLVCNYSGCGARHRLSGIYRSRAADFRFRFDYPPVWEATCPACGRRGPMKVWDQEGDLERGIRLVRLPARQFDVVHCPQSDARAYYYKIPETHKQHFRKARPELLHLEHVTMEYLEAAAARVYFEFAPGAVYHMKGAAPAGLQSAGGIPKPVLLHKEVYRHAINRKHNEVLDTDFAVPRRAVSPAPRPPVPSAGGPLGDVLGETNGADFVNRVRREFARHRVDPTHIMFMPSPLSYQLLGGEASQYAPVDRMRLAEDDIHAGNQTPVELYRGTMQWQATSTALRLHASEHLVMTDEMDGLVQWAGGQLAAALRWPEPEITFRPPAQADDPALVGMLAQLNTAGKVSDTDLLRTFNLNRKQQRRMMADETRFDMRQQAELEEENESLARMYELRRNPPPAGAAAQPGAAGPAAPGGQPPGDAAGGAPGLAGQMPVDSYLSQRGTALPTNQDELSADAAALAEQLNMVPPTLRRGQLNKLEQASPVLKRLTMAQMQEMRDQVRQDGGNQAVAAMGGG